jgi:integrase
MFPRTWSGEMASIDSRTWKNKDQSVTERHRVNFRDEAGKRRRRDFTSKRAAMAFLSTLTDNPVPGRLPASGTFRDAAEAFLTACSAGKDGGSPLEPLTLEEYRKRLDRYVLPRIGNTLLVKLTRQDMQTLRDALMADPVVRRSARKHLFLLKTVVKHARYLGWVKEDLTAGLTIRTDDRREGDEKVALHTKEEMGAILKAAESMRPRDHTMIRTMVFCGLRMSELRGLPVDAVDLQERTLRVYQRADLDGRIGPPKSRHAFRTLHLPEKLVDLLSTWLVGRDGGLAFSSPAGLPLNHSHLSHRMWRQAQIKAGVTILNPHSARHFFASMLIDSGARLKAVQEALGHHDPMFTMRVYGHLFIDSEDIDLRRAFVARMEKSLTHPEDRQIVDLSAHASAAH